MLDLNMVLFQGGKDLLHQRSEKEKNEKEKSDDKKKVLDGFQVFIK